MKIKEAGIIFPRREELASFCVVGASAEVKVLLKIAPAANVIAGENVEAAHAAKKRVFGGPAADAPNRKEFFERSGIVKFTEGFQVQCAGGNGAAEFENRALFLMAVAEGAKRARRNAGEVGGEWAGVDGGVCERRAAESFDEAIQQHHADVERNLLAGNGVEERLENGGIARRFEAFERGDERTERFLFCREGVKIAAIDFQAEHAFEGRTEK